MEEVLWLEKAVMTSASCYVATVYSYSASKDMIPPVFSAVIRQVYIYIYIYLVL